MISVAVFTYHRKDRLVKCLQSLGSNSIKEILLFNDDELQALDVSQLKTGIYTKKNDGIYY